MRRHIKPAPKLAVATHFQATDDTIDSAMQSIRGHYPKGDVTIEADFMVLTASKSGITKQRAVISDWAWYPLGEMYSDLNEPKYHNADGSMNPTAQIDQSQEIPPTDPTTGKQNYRSDGY